MFPDEADSRRALALASGLQTIHESYVTLKGTSSDQRSLHSPHMIFNVKTHRVEKTSSIRRPQVIILLYFNSYEGNNHKNSVEHMTEATVCELN